MTTKRVVGAMRDQIEHHVLGAIKRRDLRALQISLTALDRRIADMRRIDWPALAQSFEQDRQRVLAAIEIVARRVA